MSRYGCCLCPAVIESEGDPKIDTGWYVKVRGNETTFICPRCKEEVSQ